MPRPLESVPNFSEGRDGATIAALADALGERAALLDVHADRDHHRSVFTLVAREAELVESLVAGVAVARERIDLRRHEGAHPRVGAADVVPLVPLAPEDLPRARTAALVVAERIGCELALPVFLYGALASGRRTASLRSGGLSELRRRVESGELTPDFGPGRIDERSGAVLVAARPPLVAFNVNLHGATLEVAQAIARTVRERDGGFAGVRALGLDLVSAGLVQVSMNIEDVTAAPPHEVVALVRREAAARGATVESAELVGLMPAGAVAAAAAGALGLERLDASRILEVRAAWPGV